MGVERKEVNQLLYGEPFIQGLGYRDNGHRWHGMIRHGFPHEGLADYCGFFDRVSAFSGARVVMVSPDMLFNVLDERLGFLG